MLTLAQPPLAFGLYLLAGLVIAGLGRLLAGPGRPGALKSSPYASGEAGARAPASPGYDPYFDTALFFGMLHLGILVVATAGFSPGTVLFLVGLAAALLVLLVG